MTISRRQVSILAAAQTAVFLASCATGAVERPGSTTLDIDSIKEIEVKTSGASVACIPVDQPISGQILYATPAGDRRPASDVAFWVASGSARGTRLDIQVDGNGQFTGKVLLWDHEVGSRRHRAKYIPGRTLVALRATGCDEATLDVGHDWEPRTVTMTCRGRQ